MERYSDGGHILVSVGVCPIASALATNPRITVGVDLSREAVALAKSRHQPNVSFEIHEMSSYECADHDVILFSDSLYSVHPSLRQQLLRRLSRALSLRGRIVVAIAEPQRYASIFEMIRMNFRVEEDSPLEQEERHVIVFN